jgi:hypothetical protein
MNKPAGNFNWSIPAYQTDPGQVWTTECWGPVSKVVDQCDQRSKDNLQCWGTFETWRCNMVDPAQRPGVYNPNNLSGPAAGPAAGGAELPNYSRRGVSEYAVSLRRPLLSNRCWKDSFTSLGDGVVIGAGFSASPNSVV